MKRWMEVLESQKLFSFDIHGDTIVTGCTKMCGSWSMKTGTRLKPFRGVTAPTVIIKFVRLFHWTLCTSLLKNTR